MDFPEPMKLRDLLERFEPFACRPADQRPALSGVFFKPGKQPGSVVVAATDGHRLAQTIESVPGLAGVLPAAGLVVPLAELGRIQKYLHRRGHYLPGTIEPLAGSCCGFSLEMPGRAQTGTGQYGWTDGIIKARCLPGSDFPPYTRCYPAELHGGWDLTDPKLRARIAKACRELYTIKEGLTAVFDHDVTLKAHRGIPGGDLTGEAVFEVPRVQPTLANPHPRREVAVNARYLAEALEFVRAAEIYPGSELDPILVRSSEKSGLRDSALVMPCRL